MNAPLPAQAMRKPLPPVVIDEARRPCFGERFSTVDAVRDQHGRDESPYAPMPPDAVVFAQTTDEVAELVRLAADHRVPVIAFGVGTSLEGHLLALEGGISVDLSRMNAVLAVNAEDLTVTVQAGVTRKQLNNEIKDTGLFFPIDPGADATLGGMAATRASGTNAVRYGTMRENVLGLTVVTGEGKVVRTARRARKSSAGYDLTRLFVGSEGTLGIITEVTVKLYPQPEAISAATCSFPTVEAAVRTTIETIQLGVPIARCELLDALTVKAVNARNKLGLPEMPMLLFEFHGSPAGVAEQVQAVAGDRERARRGRLRLGQPARGALAAVGGAAQRLLRVPAAEAGLPQLHHRRLRADLAARASASPRRSPIPRPRRCRRRSSATSATATSTARSSPTRPAPMSSRKPSG